MKLYIHYKNKPYKLLGIVKNSETREELALYETRYESPGGRLWVRPKDMFFESIEIDGKKMPRFREASLTIQKITSLENEHLGILAGLMEKTFGQWDPKWFHGTFANHSKYLLLTAWVEGQAVGFKLGYELNPREFYSWLGGIVPEYRGLGIAGDLMKAQHQWCKEQGYQKIQTKTQNRFREMLMLDLLHGFEIIGTHASDEVGMKIILEKLL